MQKFRVNSGEAQKLHARLFQVVDDAWDMLVEGEEYDIDDGYDLTQNDNRYNLYATLRSLGGDDHKEKLGDIPLNRVKITRHQPDTCGCSVTFLWDRTTSENDREHHPHRSETACIHHAHLRGKHHDHYHEVTSENQHKNRTVEALAAHLEVHPAEVEWSHDPDRTLVLYHPHLAEGKRRGRAEHHLNMHPDAQKRPVRIDLK
jgi:hypothetical protein